jgi:hypothetical protein
MQVHAATATPDPAHPGKNFTVSLSTSEAERVDDGTLSLSLSYRVFNLKWVRVFSTSGTLCDSVGCPLAPGNHTLAFHTSIPGSAPRVRMRWQDEAGFTNHARMYG